MSKAFKCDACDKYFDFNNEEADEIIIRHGKPTRLKGLNTPQFTFEEKRFECCPECIDAIKNTMNERKAKKK